MTDSAARQGRPPVWEQHRAEMVRLYGEGMSRRQIARQLGTSLQTVTRQLLAATKQAEHAEAMAAAKQVEHSGPGTRTSATPERQAEINARISAARTGKGTGPRVARSTLTCQRNGCEVQFEGFAGRPGSKFCSTRCSTAHNAEIKRAATRAAYEADPRRCPCGTAIDYEHRASRQFCSVEHQKQYQPKRQADPANSRTFTCQNPACGKEVTRHNSYGRGAAKFCSIACSNKVTKVKRHYVLRDSDVVLDSGWEALFWGLCMFLKVAVERVDRQTVVELGPKSHYAPDFWLPAVGVWVEVKGLEDDGDAARWAAWREQRGPLVIVEREVLDGLRRSPTADGFEESLRVLSQLTELS